MRGGNQLWYFSGREWAHKVARRRPEKCQGGSFALTTLISVQGHNNYPVNPREPKHRAA
jgi:hypothetical protein